MDGEVPFRTVLLHGLVRDGSGKKMSKSRGNVVDPLVWIDEYGADAVRMSLLQGANPGADQAINEEWVVGARNFCTKLWNATRFALISGATVDGPVPETRDRRRTRGSCPGCRRSSTEVDELYERYEFAKIADLLYHFAWDEVCDWYIELAKLSLAGPGRCRHPAGARRGAGHAAAAAAPDVPFVTEALWTALTGGESVVVAAWPRRRCRPRRRRRGGRGRRAAGRRHRGAPVPLRPGRQAGAAGAGAPGRRRGRGRGRDPGAAAPRRAGRGLRRRPPRSPRPRRAGRARPVRCDRRGRGAGPADQGPRGGARRSGT